MTEVLFDLDLPEPAPPEPKISTDRRRTQKQAAALDSGSHPLSVYLQRPLKLHPDAAPANDRKADGARCRTCTHLTGNHRGYIKCGFDDGVRASFGAASDARTWWPACVDYQPKNGPENS